MPTFQTRIKILSIILSSKKNKIKNKKIKTTWQSTKLMKTKQFFTVLHRRIPQNSGYDSRGSSARKSQLRPDSLNAEPEEFSETELRRVTEELCSQQCMFRSAEGRLQICPSLRSNQKMYIVLCSYLSF